MGRWITKEKLIELAAYAEKDSTHPISTSIRDFYGKTIDGRRIKNVKEIAGFGVQAELDGKVILAGNAKLMREQKIAFAPVDEPGTVVYVAEDGRYAGAILIEDEIKADAAAAIKDLKASGVKKTVMLTGDAAAVGKKVAAKLKLDAAYTELLPADKVDHMEQLLSETSDKGKLTFVGDGINDAPV